jgi:hypothetical protein
MSGKNGYTSECGFDEEGRTRKKWGDPVMYVLRDQDDDGLTADDVVQLHRVFQVRSPSPRRWRMLHPVSRVVPLSLARCVPCQLWGDLQQLTEKDVAPEWISAADCLRLSCKPDAWFLLAVFRGPVFSHLLSLGCRSPSSPVISLLLQNVRSPLCA